MRLSTHQAKQFRWDTIISLDAKGTKQSDIAALLSIQQSSVSRVLARHREEGRAQIKKAKGAPNKLTLAQKQRLSDLLKQGRVRYGFEGEYWTNKRIIRVIEEQFGVVYTVSPISKIVKKLGFSKQKFKQVDARQDASKVAAWKDERLPELKKKPV
jgi:transposase